MKNRIAGRFMVNNAQNELFSRLFSVEENSSKNVY